MRQMKRTVASIFALTLVIFSIEGTDAAPPKQTPSKNQKQGNPSSAPTASVPQPPSLELSNFINQNLDIILGPLEQKAPLPRSELAQLRTSFESARAKSPPATQKQYKAALAVCDALAKAMDERERAMLQPTAITAWPQRAAQYRDVINQLMKKEKAAEAPVNPEPKR
jgi:hypothetical protein